MQIILGLSGRALNETTGVFIRERQGKFIKEHRKDDVTMVVEIRVMWPQTKECWQPPRAGINSLLQPWFWPSDSDFKVIAFWGINPCCPKPTRKLIHWNEESLPHVSPILFHSDSVFFVCVSKFQKAKAKWEKARAFSSLCLQLACWEPTGKSKSHDW